MQRITETASTQAATDRKTPLMQLPPELVVELQRSLEDRLGEKAGEFFYAAATAWATGESRRLKSLLAEEAVELAGAFCRVMTERGWGRWQVESFEPQAGLLRIRVTLSPLARGYGQSEQPVCHLLCGAVAGLAEGLLGLPANASEILCAARGDPHCLFEARALSEIKEESWQW